MILLLIKFLVIFFFLFLMVCLVYVTHMSAALGVIAEPASRIQKAMGVHRYPIKAAAHKGFVHNSPKVQFARAELEEARMMLRSMTATGRVLLCAPSNAAVDELVSTSYLRSTVIL